MRRLRCVCCAMTRVAALYLTSACHAQDKNQISRLDGVIFPSELTMLELVGFFAAWCVDVKCEAVAVWILCDNACCIVVSDV